MDGFRRGDLVFDVRDGGPPGGDPVVLLHGFPQDAGAWDAVAPLLHADGLRTLAPDQRGYSPGGGGGGGGAGGGGGGGGGRGGVVAPPRRGRGRLGARSL
ncbi:alpha/beta fold hydrolase, partial [Geodermatophilus sp. SYSU D00758]